MTTFAEKEVIYSDGQINVMPLPEAIMANGFIPETRDAPGMPLAAQHLNWLFRDLYRQTNILQMAATSLNQQILPAWVPVPCPLEIPPEGYLKCNGAAFDKDKYPELAKGYPSGFLPDLRGEFIRGWDDGRGVDAERKILSEQNYATAAPINNQPKRIGDSVSALQALGKNPSRIGFVRVTNVGERLTATSSDEGGSGSELDIVNVMEGDIETRPRNIAFLYIVRAA